MNLFLLLTFHIGMEFKLILSSFTLIFKASQHLELKEFDAIFSRIDLYYDSRNQSKDKIGSQEFINSSFCQFQISHSRKNLQVKKNKKGLVFKIGSRATQKYYRVYTKDNFLRFEFISLLES